jgi:hypothetical protein
MLKRLRTVVLAVFTLLIAVGLQQQVFSNNLALYNCECTPIGFNCEDPAINCSDPDLNDDWCSRLCGQECSYGQGWLAYCDDNVALSCACAPV